MDNGFNLVHRAPGQGFNGRIQREKLFSDDVDPGVGALGGQAYADQKLPGIVVFQGTLYIGIGVLQTCNHVQRQLFFLHEKPPL